jgi:TPR repeat protein
MRPTTQPTTRRADRRTMQPDDSKQLFSILRRGASLLPLMLVASACATSGVSGPTKVEKHVDGFTISEEVRVGLGARSDFEGAVRLLREEAYAEGIELLLEVTESAPHLTAAHINLGIAYRETGDLERARASLERALELNPRHPAAYNELGIVYRRSGEFEKARKSYEGALDLFPDFHYARRNLAILCDLFLADISCAIEQYELYTEAVPNDAEAAMWVADLRNRAGR